MNKNFICTLPNGDEITSVVLDLEEYESLIDILHNTDLGGASLSKEQADRLKEAKHIQMISRGTKTAFVFDRFDIKTNVACFIVRGHGSELLNQLSKKLKRRDARNN